ncbi:hypothetical protein B0O80DRAFT_432084 [Mortierella sp. GBAus27b]|nr:hypothetical protein BGX31_002157 [Mortierella sp. GBA43]KAI8362878.1 hypothetical protein B0O80DRAFT_432084 [Mortierella sp. GBAus27b]
MQFKTLAFALAALAAVSAQAIVDNACSQCAKAAITKEPTCASLPAADMQQLQTIFGGANVDVGGLMTAAQNIAIKTCLCRWGTGTFTSTGAAASCTVPQGATPAACTPDQIKDGEATIAPLAILIRCDELPASAPGNGTSAPAPSSGSGTPTSGAGAGTPTPGAGAGAGGSNSAGSTTVLSTSYVALATAFGLAAMAGL